MGLKLQLDPTIPKAVIIAMLLFIEAFFLPLQKQVASGIMPTEIDILNALFGAIIVLVTFLLAFLGYEKAKPEVDKEKEIRDAT